MSMSVGMATQRKRKGIRREMGAKLSGGSLAFLLYFFLHCWVRTNNLTLGTLASFLFPAVTIVEGHGKLRPLLELMPIFEMIITYDSPDPFFFP